MRQKICTLALGLLVAALIMVPSTGWSHELFGGITFLGDRKGVCISIKGECISSIDFQLDTCDSNLNSKEKYKNKMPFTVLVPKGTQQLLVTKDGKIVVDEPVTIEAEKVLEYQLPQ